jgi:putative spermidine/putrescine transport system ATP-binding protein
MSAPLISPASGPTNALNASLDSGASSSARQLEAVNVSKYYGNVRAVADLSFEIKPGEFLTLLGPSGSGKSTTLLMVAGFEAPTSGDIRIEGRSIVGQPPQRRNLGIVFQSHSLFPHMSVLENVEFALRMRRIQRDERRRRALKMLAMVGLAGFERRRPTQLSGGEQQRVALARALVFEPDLLLLDEPLGALDKRLRDRLQIEIRRIHRELGVSVLFITHDQEEAMMMSDRIGVMDQGQLLQVGIPEDVYLHPRNAFIARFLGETNLVPCVQIGETAGGLARVMFAGGTSGFARSKIASVQHGNCAVSIRPERIEFGAARQPTDTGLEGIVVERTFLGTHLRYVIRALDVELIVRRPVPDHSPPVGVLEKVRIAWSADAAQVLSD